MPTSTWVHVSDVMEIVAWSNARSLLDVGCGWGRFGLLFRDMLDVINARWTRKEWLTKIHGIEPTLKYLNPVHSYVYDHVWPMSVQAWLDTYCQDYQVIWCGDVLEHLPPEESMKVARHLVTHTTELFIAGVPVGDKWPQGAVNGNQFEVHRTAWTKEMIESISTTRKYYTVGFREYAVFTVEPGGSHHMPVGFVRG